ncbi:MAG: phosphate acyltransferase PlsX [Trueperaceae bacterium]|nr:MAG: phosphate acyltransferase PlsX [Trueperaceae bacterium]
MKPIALDAMGGDHMPAAAVEGAVAAAREGIPVVLVGDEDVLEAELAKHGEKLPIHPAEDVIAMEDSAVDVRRRRQSSVMVAMRLVKEGEASACISMGHSGATMAAALLVLGRLRGVERPAILANIPIVGGYAALIDVGANAENRAIHLQQFAVMGSLYAEAFYQKEAPTVGLMSIGEEPQKGTDLTREAHELLKGTPGINFFGNVEGRDLFMGTTDVVVTDGFTGNVMLKLAEGEARVLFGMIRTALSSSLPVRLAALVVRPALRKIRDRFDPAEYGAQPLLGVDGYVLIGHGRSDGRSVQSAIRTARRAVEAELLGKIRGGLGLLGERVSAS